MWRKSFERDMKNVVNSKENFINVYHICDLLEYKVMNNEVNRKSLGDLQSDFAKKTSCFYLFLTLNCITHNLQ